MPPRLTSCAWFSMNSSTVALLYRTFRLTILTRRSLRVSSVIARRPRRPGSLVLAEHRSSARAEKAKPTCTPPSQSGWLGEKSLGEALRSGPHPWALQRVAHRACETLFAFVDGARKPCESFFAGIVKPARLAFHLGVAEERVREPREHGRHIGMNIDAPGSNALCGHLSPGMPLARRARAQGPVVDGIDAKLNVDVEPMCRHAQNLIEERLSLQRVVLGYASAQNPYLHGLLQGCKAVMLNGTHFADIVVDIDFEFEVVAEHALELDHVQEDGPVLNRPYEDGSGELVRRRQERRLFRTKRRLEVSDAPAQEEMQLWRCHLSLELVAAQNR